MNVEELRALFAGETAARLKAIVDRLDQIDAEIQKLAQERSDLDAELRKTLGEIGHSEPSKAEATERRKRRASCAAQKATLSAGRKLCLRPYYLPHLPRREATRG